MIDGKWEVLSFYGQAQDIGAQFVIAAAVVSDPTNQLLDNWVQTSQKTNNYLPIAFPAVVDGCPVARVTATKTAH